MASPSCPFRTSDPFAARQHALQWAYASWQDAVILLDPCEIDGPEVVALSQDCQEHARARGLLP